MNKITNCPICGHHSFNSVLVCKDHTVSHKEFSIVECNKCHFWFTNPIPKIEEIGKYYESEDYVSHSNTNKGLIHKLYQSVRNYTLKQKLGLIDGLKTEGKNILDIGSGTGEFANICQTNGWNVIGIEPSDKARQLSIDNYQLDIKKEDQIANLESGSMDIVSMWHVLEHVYYLEDRMKEIKRLLKNEGFLIIAVPNRLSYDAQHYQENWAAYDLPRHLYHFTPNDISNLSDKFGFKVVKTLPMKFDSFYVSMLSEKYKTGSINYIKAFLNGLASNNKAGDKNEYSSQIYFLKNEK